MEPKVCPVCGSTHIVKDPIRGEIYCADCGAVIEENLIDMGPEWRVFEPEQFSVKSRAGSPLTNLSHDRGVSTEIVWSDRDYQGNKLPPRMRANVYRIKKWHQRIKVNSSLDRNLSVALHELNNLATKLGLPQHVKETAALIYREAATKNLIRGRSIGSIVAAAIYTACRMEKMPRTLDEIANISGIPKKKIGRSYRQLRKDLQLNLSPPDPFQYIHQFVEKLKLDKRVEMKSHEIVRLALESGEIGGKGPTGIAAAAVYIAALLNGQPKTQKEIAKVAGVTEVTIRNRYKEIVEALKLDIPQDMIPK